MHFLPVFVSCILIPILVFGSNWALRYRQGYNQTAAADFLLALMVFDGAVISTSDVFQPFVANPQLRGLVVNWHMFMGALCIGLWWLIVHFGEPKLETYYKEGAVGYFPPCRSR